nr:hypothetical protein [Dickeya sp. CSL RW240]
MHHRAGLHLPVAVAEPLTRRPGFQRPAQEQPAALVGQQASPVHQPLAGHRQRAALQPAVIRQLPGRDRHRPVRQQATGVVHLPGPERQRARGQRPGVVQPADPELPVAARHHRAGVDQHTTAIRLAGQRDVQRAVTLQLPGVAQLPAGKAQATRLPHPVTGQAGGTQQRRARTQQLAVVPGGQGGGLQRQPAQAQQTAQVRYLPGPQRQRVALHLAAVIQPRRRNIQRTAAQPLPACVVRRRPGNGQRQRVHPQQRAAAVQRSRLHRQPLPFQPPAVTQAARRAGVCVEPRRAIARGTRRRWRISN